MQRLDTLGSTSDQQIKELKKAIKDINEQIGTNAQKVVLLEQEKISGIENTIKTLNEQTGNRLDTLDNMSDQQTKELK